MTLLFLPFVLKSQTKRQILKQDFQSSKSYALEYVWLNPEYVHVCALKMLDNMLQHLIMAKYNVYPGCYLVCGLQ